MTERLYYTDAYAVEFTGRVVEQTGSRVYLDRTAFYPTSGGQHHDVGTLGDRRVVDVIDEGDRIAHIIEGVVPAAEVTGVIDWTRRFDHMQQHTGQHLLSALIAAQFDRQTKSVHFGPDYATIDFEGEPLTDEYIRALELEVNRLVAENRQVTVTFEESVSASELRKPSERSGRLRIVTIDGLDRSACGGTHVSGTAGIGPVHLRTQERTKGNTRLGFRCGTRAVRRARQDFELLSSTARFLSSAVDEVPVVVEARDRELKDQAAQLRRLGSELTTLQAQSLVASASARSDGLRIVVHQADAGEQSKALALAVAAQDRAVYVHVDPARRTIVVSASADSGIDAGQILKAALTTVGGRGGGSSTLAQGSAPDDESLVQLSKAVEMSLT
ncbi:MAG: alanyl-tRNA editing protein [Gemmatimonadota bacterium]